MIFSRLRRAAGVALQELRKPIRNPIHTESYAQKIIKCKAAVAWAPGEPLVVEQVEVDPPRENEARIKITHTSLCQTDLTYWKDKDTDLFPRIFGHEAAGIVESVGEGVTDLQPGDHVIPVLQGECKQCKYCSSDKTNLCGSLRADLVCKGVYGSQGSSRFRAANTGASISHFLGTSTFSQFTVVHQGCLAKVDKQAPLDKICLLGCGLTTGLGAVWKAAKVEKGASVAVFGLGTIGLAIAQAAKASGASRIIGVDINPSKFHLGKTFGVTDFVNPKDYERPIQEVIVELSGGGVDYSFECIGNTKLMRAAVESTHDAWGLTVVVGVPTDATLLEINPVSLLFGHTIKGTVIGGYRPSDLPALVDKYLKKEIKVDEYVTHNVPLERINDAFELLTQGDLNISILSIIYVKTRGKTKHIPDIHRNN